jgi:hypothetical protein
MPLSSLAPDAFRQSFSEEDFDLPLSELYNDARAGFMRVFG